ncbi:MAG: YihY/virulence factor BrkB family protein [Jatrophihabitans sp.]|uniref:YihY/virulence factor BrkB family protein n=1 Tax=Jatrophihabitans sp. TaxID=1932789 RepID=UPI0039134EA2
MTDTSRHPSPHGANGRNANGHSADERTNDEPNAAESGETPRSPTELPKKSWVAVLRRAVKQIQPDELTDRAAALTYYGVQAIFPGILVLVSILGLLGHSTAQSLIDNLGQVAPGSVKSFLQTVIQNAQKQKGAAGILGIVGILLALWSASGYVAAFMRASNRVYSMPEGRSIWKTAPTRLGVTVFTVLCLVVGLVIVVATGTLADQIGKALGIGSTAVTVWEIAKWPVLLLIFALMLAVLYAAAPNVRHGGFRWISPGAALAVVVWLAASGLFAVYVANFGSYNKTYGSLSAVIVFLVWLWISNLAILLGVEFDAELEHERALREGVPEDSALFARPKDTRKFDDAETREAEKVQRLRGKPEAASGAGSDQQESDQR